MHRMRWGVGFLRLWAVASLAWLAYAAVWTYFNPANKSLLGRDLGEGWHAEPQWDVLQSLTQALLPPVLALILGFALFWIIRGFVNNKA